MRHPLAALVLLAAVLTVGLACEPGLAQGQSEKLPLPPGGFKPPPAAPVKPYKPVAITPAAPFTDPSFAAFRKQLGDIAQHKDRAALAKLVVAQGFFWLQDKDLADKRKSGIDNLAKAIDLDAKDGSGWDVLAGYANEPTASPFAEHQGVMCAPANPRHRCEGVRGPASDATQTDPSEWAYPLKDGVEVRNAASRTRRSSRSSADSLVRVLPDTASAERRQSAEFLHVATPCGKTGLSPSDAILRARRRRNVLQQGRERLEDCRLFRRRRGVAFRSPRPWRQGCENEGLERAALPDDNGRKQAGRDDEGLDETRALLRWIGVAVLCLSFRAGVGATGSIAGLSLLQADDRGRRARRRPRQFELKSSRAIPASGGVLSLAASRRHHRRRDLRASPLPDRESDAGLRYGIGVGRDGFTWQGLLQITRKPEWPDWHPPPEMIERQPYLPRFMAGGPGNPLGARAMYLGNTVYRIHGTNAPETIGHAVSSGLLPPGQ